MTGLRRFRRQGSGKRADHRGRRAELWARVWLVLKGYRILAHRFKSPRGEVDIVAQKRNTIIFAEVKARGSLQDAKEALRFRQRARIEGAADHFMKTLRQRSGREKSGDYTVRFDLIAIVPRRLPRHMKGVWRTGPYP